MSDNLFSMTPEFQKHIEIIKKNIQPSRSCIVGYLPVSDKTAEKRRQILCNMIDWMANTKTGRQILTMTASDVKIFSLSKINKKNGCNFGESYGMERCLVLSPQQLHLDLYYECLNSLAHELTHLINYDLKRYILKTAHNKLNPYDELCLSFFDEVSAVICGDKVVNETLNQPQQPICLTDIIANKMYWHWHYCNALWQLTDYRRPIRQAKTIHTPSYYKLWRAYFSTYPELQYPELVRYIHQGAGKLMRPIFEDMKRHGIEPHGKKLVDRYYPLVRHLRSQMSRDKE